MDIANNPTGQPTASVGMVIKPSGKTQENNATKIITGVNFLSYNYLYDEDSKDNIVPSKAAFTKLSNVITLMISHYGRMKFQFHLK